MMPVPSHLAECAVPKDVRVDEEPLDAVIKCNCGSVRFRLMYPGQTHVVGGETIPCTATTPEGYFFLVRADCVGCNREHVLLDADLHGWNGFVCHEAELARRTRPPLVAWKCLGCGSVEHEVSVQIQTEGKDDFIDQAGDEFDEDRWPDGFGWFSAAIACGSCGRQSNEWVSYETM
jgi:hypothetical protein